MTFMLFLGMANAYIMRTNMSVAIVAMVNHTAIEDPHDTHGVSVDEECGIVNDPNATTSKVGEIVQKNIYYCMKLIRKLQ